MTFQALIHYHENTLFSIKAEISLKSQSFDLRKDIKKSQKWGSATAEVDSTVMSPSLVGVGNFGGDQETDRGQNCHSLLERDAAWHHSLSSVHGI